MALHRNQKLNLLRLVVLLTVTLAGIKFFFRDRLVLRETGTGEEAWSRVLKMCLAAVIFLPSGSAIALNMCFAYRRSLVQTLAHPGPGLSLQPKVVW